MIYRRQERISLKKEPLSVEKGPCNYIIKCLDFQWYIAVAIWYTAKPYDIFAAQIWYNIRSFICRRHISSTEGGYHIKDISPVPQGTDIIVKNLFCQVDKRDFLHGSGIGIRTPTNRVRVCRANRYTIPLYSIPRFLGARFIVSPFFRNVKSFFGKIYCIFP